MKRGRRAAKLRHTKKNGPGGGGLTKQFCYLSTELNAIHEAADTRPAVGVFTEILDKVA
jgi:hypothetical protein